MNQRALKYDAQVVITCIAAVYLLCNFVLPLVSYNFFGTYLARPIVWGALAVIVFKMPAYKTLGKMRMRSMLILAGVTVAGFQVSIMVGAGLAAGFGKSPYSFTPTGIILNIFYVFMTLIAMEYTRSWVIGRFSKRRPALTVALVALIYTFFLFPYSKITGQHGTLELVRLFGETVLPSFAESLFASLLALLGGALPAIAYRSLVQLFLWFCPVLPNLDWTIHSLINVIVPVLGFIMVQKLYLSETGQVERRMAEKDNPVGWIAAALLSVLLLWFPTGLLGVYPSVIISGSMRPGIEIGDMIIVKKVSKPEQIKKTDIIQFINENRLTVTHRVIEVRGDSKVLITRGDANKIADSPVEFQNVRGKVIAKLPKIGWVSLFLRKLVKI